MILFTILHVLIRSLIYRHKNNSIKSHTRILELKTVVLRMHGNIDFEFIHLTTIVLMLRYAYSHIRVFIH